MLRRNHIPLLQQQQRPIITKKPKFLTRQFFEGYDFRKVKSALTNNNTLHEDSSNRSTRQFEFQPKFSPFLVSSSSSSNNNSNSNESSTALKIILSDTSPFEVEREINHQLSENSNWNWTLKISESSSSSPASSSSSWNAYVGTASDLKTKSEVFDHNQETLKHTSSSSGNHSCRSQLPSDMTLLSSGKHWLSHTLQNRSGIVFQRVESQETEAVVSKQQLSKFTRDQTHATATTGSNANYSVTESEVVARGLNAAYHFDHKLKKQAEKFFAEEMELAERSPIFAVSAEMNEWCLVGDTASHPVNVRRLLLNFFTCYCMKVFGGVPVSAECIAVKKSESDKNDSDDNNNDQDAILICGPSRSGKTSLAKHVVNQNPEKYFHVGSGIVVIAPVRFDFETDDENIKKNNNKNQSSLLRVIPLPIAPTFSDAGILWSSLLLNNIHDDSLLLDSPSSTNMNMMMRKWAIEELSNLPSEWKRKLSSSNVMMNDFASIPRNSFFSSSERRSSKTQKNYSSSSSSFSDFSLKGLVTLNWDLNTFGDFELESQQLLSSSTSKSNDNNSQNDKKEKLRLAFDILKKEKYPCYVRDMNDEEVAKALAFAACPPYLSKRLYFNEHKRLSDQLFEWGMNNSLSANDGTFSATEINGTVRFDLARKHVAQVLDSLVK